MRSVSVAGALEDHDGHRRARLVRQAHVRPADAPGLERRPGAAVQDEPWRFALAAPNLDVGPLHPLQAGAERLDERLLGREPGGQTLRGARTIAASLELPVGEQALLAALAEPLEQVGDPRRVHVVDAYPNNHLFFALPRKRSGAGTELASHRASGLYPSNMIGRMRNVVSIGSPSPAGNA